MNTSRESLSVWTVALESAADAIRLYFEPVERAVKWLRWRRHRQADTSGHAIQTIESVIAEAVQNAVALGLRKAIAEARQAQALEQSAQMSEIELLQRHLAAELRNALELTKALEPTRITARDWYHLWNQAAYLQNAFSELSQPWGTATRQSTESWMIDKATFEGLRRALDLAHEGNIEGLLVWALAQRVELLLVQVQLASERLATLKRDADPDMAREIEQRLRHAEDILRRATLLRSK